MANSAFRHRVIGRGIRLLYFLCSLILAPLSLAYPESFHSSCGSTTCSGYIVDVSTDRLELLDRDENGSRFQNAEGLERWATARNLELLFATNSGIFDTSFRPLGLYIKKGAQIVPVNKSSGEGNFFLKPNGIFYVQDSSAFIVETSNFIPNTKIILATQSGPLLVENGNINPKFSKNSDNLKIRSGVGVTEGHKVVFAISDSAINFFDFASFFKTNMNCANALYLDGVISKAYNPEIGRLDKQGDFAALFAIFKMPFRKLR